MKDLKGDIMQERGLLIVFSGPSGVGKGTVRNDSDARDRMIGAGDIDWFFSSAKDVVVDFKSRIGESRDTI